MIPNLNFALQVNIISLVHTAAIFSTSLSLLLKVEAVVHLYTTLETAMQAGDNDPDLSLNHCDMHVTKLCLKNENTECRADI